MTKIFEVKSFRKVVDIYHVRASSTDEALKLFNEDEEGAAIRYITTTTVPNSNFVDVADNKTYFWIEAEEEN